MFNGTRLKPVEWIAVPNEIQVRKFRIENLRDSNRERERERLCWPLYKPKKMELNEQKRLAKRPTTVWRERSSK